MKCPCRRRIKGAKEEKATEEKTMNDTYRGAERRKVVYLFIEQPPQAPDQSPARPYRLHGRKTRREDAIRDGHTSKLVDRRPKRQNVAPTLLLLAAISAVLCCQCSPPCQLLAAAEQQEASAKLPTVIVRGFLNYRTTVDGTVLLFTPDAGGSAHSSSISQTITLASATLASASQQPVQPTQRAELRPAALEAGSEPREEQPADQWRPVQATPPLLRPTQSNSGSSSQSTKQQPDLETSSMLISAGGSSSSAADVGLPISSQPAAINGKLAAIGPSVQTEELADLQQTEPAARGQPTRAVVKSRRPSLGFHGQGARANARPTAEQPSSGGSSSSGSINGIRRPGLPTSSSSTTTTSSPTNESPAGQPVVSAAFQARLQSAKLRNKFRKPGSSAAAGSSAGGGGGSGGNSSTPIGSSLPLATEAAAAAVEAENLHQDGSTNLASTTNQQWPVAAELQPPRSGDIFNPGAAAAAAAAAASPVVGSDEILIDSSSSADASESDQRGATNEEEHAKLESRLGEQRPRAEPELLTGALSGTIENSGAPLTFDSFFQSDQPASKPASAAASEHKPNHLAPRKKTHNEKINGWLDQHHNKFVPRPSTPASPAPSHQTHHLAPSFASHIPSGAAAAAAAAAATPSTPLSSQPAPIPTATVSLSGDQAAATKPAVGSALDESAPEVQHSAANGTLATPDVQQQVNGSETVQMQTITKTYSTVMTSLRTRLVPLQVKSSTGVHTLTESYVITKLMTAYQTMPVGEFILPEPLSTRAPFEMFNEPASSSVDEMTKNKAEPVAAPSNFAAPAQAPAQAQAQAEQEQPITLSENQKSANDWLHDFSSQNPFNPSQPQQPQQQQHLQALLEQQAQEANLAGLGLSGEPLDQLASSLDPAALLADGSINIPDLNNPLVLAAAIQNPQLAAVILAAQQLRLRQQQQQQQQQQRTKPLLPNHNNNQAQVNQLQPSYSTSLSTQIRPSTYTVRDTMYTTRLVSFKDGRTVRTRTVSEPGSVIEQVLTTMATEVTPITITIRPTGVLAAGFNMQATAAATTNNNQATINNALFATQLANLLARRQQQLQPGQPQSNQLSLLQQLLAGQQQQQSAANARPQQQQQQQQFQPNLQQLLSSMQQQPASSNTAQQANGKAQQPAATVQQDPQQQQQQQASLNRPEPDQATATPPLPALASSGPIVTTLTNLQVRTYTVHNAFKTIYRTITSTQLVTSTILPMRNSQLPLLG